MKQLTFMNSELESIRYFFTFHCSVVICWFCILSSIQSFKQNFSTGKKKHQNKILHSQSNETLNDVLIGNGPNADAIEKENCQPQTSVFVNNFESSAVGQNSASHNYFLKGTFSTKLGKKLTMPLQLLKIWVPEVILIPMDKVVILPVETAVRLITQSPGRGLNSMVENPDHRDFSGNIENTPLMSASSSVDLNIDQDKNGEVRNVENFEDSDFLALRPDYDRLATLITTIETLWSTFWKEFSSLRQYDVCVDLRATFCSEQT